MEQHKTLRQLLDEIELKEENIQLISNTLIGEGTAVIPTVQYDLGPNDYIYRARPHGPNTMYYIRRDVSYPPEPWMVKTGRANMIGNRTFYGGFHTRELSQGQVIAMQEASEVRNGWYPPVQTFTVSRWRPRHPVSLATFVTGEVLASGSKVARAMFESTKKMLDHLPDQYRQHATELLSVLHDEFTKEVDGDPEKYWISAVFASIIYTKSIGIVYPSKRTEYMGWNVAVPADAWDENFELCDSGLYQYHSANKETFAIPFKYAGTSNEPFPWTDAKHPEGTNFEFRQHDYPHKKPE